MSIDSACPWPSIKSDCFGIRTREAAASCIKKWIKTCNDGHEHCQQELLLQKLPTRVLEITDSGQIRLRVTKEHEEGRYACLSHCWGGLPTLRTTKATYMRHQDNISWTILPATFKDAVDLTRLLGLRFLWIDSLCIIQDDTDDWRHEGSKMASIYADSYITLAAVASKNADQGLYRPKDPDLYFRYDMRRSSDQAPYTIHVHPRRDHVPFVAGTLPLLQRAWYYQERILSTRVVSFGETELYWECRATQCCECGDTWPQRFTAESSKIDVPQYSDAFTYARSNNIHKWQHLVKQYTRLNLTFEADMLPALQGIASTWQREKTGAYLAGLWEKNLVEGLLWRSQLCGHRPSSYRAPTWSWASIHGWIDWWPEPIPARNEVVSILDVSTTPAGEDPRGEVTAGTLVIKGRCVLANLVYEGTHELYRPGNCVKFQRGPDGVSEGPKVGPGDWFPDLAANVETDSEFLLMQIVDMQEATHRIVYFLALRRKRGDDTVYERVGCARTDAPDVRLAFENWGKEMVITVV